jgi:hypothetical protein
MSKKFLLCVPRDNKEKPSHGKFRYRHEENNEWMDEMHNLCLMIPQNTSKRTSKCIFQHEDFEFVHEDFSVWTNGTRECLGVPSSICYTRGWLFCLAFVIRRGSFRRLAEWPGM